MILADTSVWVDHLRRSNGRLIALLDENLVGTHPFVIAEIMLGRLRNRDTVVSMLSNLPDVRIADTDEILPFIQRWRLWGRGIGFVDTHLLASVLLTPGTRLWTRDKRLGRVAMELRIAADFD